MLGHSVGSLPSTILKYCSIFAVNSDESHQSVGTFSGFSAKYDTIILSNICSEQ